MRGEAILEGFLYLVENNVHATLINQLRNSRQYLGNKGESDSPFLSLCLFLPFSSLPLPPFLSLPPSLSSFLNFFFFLSSILSLI